jgi:hypothetical protein
VLRIRVRFRLLLLFRMMLFAHILLLFSVICAVGSVRTLLIINSKRKMVPHDRSLRARNSASFIKLIEKWLCCCGCGKMFYQSNSL